MRYLLYIVVFTFAFLWISLLLHYECSEALPIALLGGCVGWAWAEFRREIKEQSAR